LITFVSFTANGNSITIPPGAFEFENNRINDYVPLYRKVRNGYVSIWNFGHKKRPDEFARPLVGLDGGDEGIRTLDLSVANAALSQLSYIPTGA
jgi:hypothetical protein